MANKADKLTANNADRHALYELATQQPILMVGFLEDVAERFEIEPPLKLREDFCGTAYLASTWVRSAPDRTAIGVDVDAEIIDYAEANNQAMLGDDAKRLKLRCADVKKCSAKADTLVALNFSSFIYKTRRDMLSYLKHARRCLHPGGLFVMDTYGGPGAWATCVDKRSFGDFDYRWEQAFVDPVTNEVINHIHFDFEDGSSIKQAFTYYWRLWTIAELREMLETAGFGTTAVWFEAEDGFLGEDDLEEAEAFVAYIVAQA